MFGERQTRDLLASADPARDVPVPPPVWDAHDLIVRAEQQDADMPRRLPRVGRRLVLASATALVAATVVAVAVERHHGDPGPRPAARGVVVKPIAFTITDHPPAAKDELLELADRIGDAPWDAMTGPYTFHHVQEWGTFGVGAENDRYRKSSVDDLSTWSAADGAGRWLVKHLPPQYRDEASRAYFETEPDILDGTSDSEGASRPWNRPALPTGTAALSKALYLAVPTTVTHRLTDLYKDYAIPRATRADLLRILAGLPYCSWRGPVVDRAGRAGVAVTYQTPDFRDGYQELLIFDPSTGALLAHERTSKENGQTFVEQYILILETRLTTDTR